MITNRPQLDILPQHTPTEVEALREELKANGLKVPVVDETDTVIDGRLRASLCDELKIDWRLTAKMESGLSDDQKAALRIRLNLLRRSTPPTASQRREYVRTLLKAEPTLSNGSIGRLCGMDSSNVSRIRSEMEAVGEAKPVDATTGLDGKTRQKPPRQAAPKPAARQIPQASSKPEVQEVVKLPQRQPRVSVETTARPTDDRSPIMAAVGDSPSTSSVPVMSTETASEAPQAEGKQGRLECSTFKLTLTKAVSARSGCWEWLAKDEQGNNYHLTCRQVEVATSELRKVG